MGSELDLGWSELKHSIASEMNSLLLLFVVGVEEPKRTSGAVKTNVSPATRRSLADLETSLSAPPLLQVRFPSRVCKLENWVQLVRVGGGEISAKC